MTQRRSIDGSASAWRRSRRATHDEPADADAADTDTQFEQTVTRSIEKERRVRTIDLRDFEEGDFASLKKEDPFQYYSIPGVRAAKMALEDADHSDANSLCRGSSEKRSATRRAKRARANTEVSRRSRISFESHPMAMYEDMLNEFSASLSLSEVDDEDTCSLNDPLVSYLLLR